MRKRWQVLYKTNFLKQLRCLYDKFARFRSLQMKNLTWILREKSFLLTIMLIDVDKSLLFVLLTLYKISEIIVVIVFLISLRQDLIQ